MAEVVERLKFEADIADIKTALQEIQGSMQDTANKAEEHGVVYQKMFEMAQVGAKAVFDFYKQGIQAAVDYEQQLNKLGAALEATGQGRDNIDRLKNEAAALENLTGIEEEQIIAVQKMALNYGVNVENMDRTMKAAAALAAVTGQDLNSAFTTLARIQETGTVPRTLQAMEAFKGLSKEQLQNLDIVDLVNNKLGSQLTAGMEGAAGAVTRLRDAFGDWGRDLGTYVIPTLTDLANRLADVVKYLSGGGLGDYWAAEVEQIRAAWSNNDALGIMKAAGKLAADPYGMLFGGGGASTSGGITYDMSQDWSGGPTGPLRPTGKAFGEPGRGGKGKGIEWDWQDAGKDMVMTELGMMPKSEWEKMVSNGESNYNQMLSIFDKYNQSRMRMAEDRYNYEKTLEDKETEYKRKQLQEREKEANRQNEMTKKSLQLVGGITSNIANTTLDTLERWAEGQDVSMASIVKSFVSGTGKMLISQGIANMIQGFGEELAGANPLFPRPDMIAHGAMLQSFGAAELGIGTTMAAGGLVMSALGFGKGGGGGGGGGHGLAASPSKDFAGGSAGSRGGGGGGGDRIFNVTVTGPVLSSLDFGVAVKRALEEATKVGV